MAITKLMHQKESKTGRKSLHLENAVSYILNPGKCGGGLLVAGNCGTTAGEVIGAMLATKEMWQKDSGRQGYHFVISLEDGAGDERTLLSLAADFCSDYLGDEYEYVCAVHNNTDNLHAHIIFNSVSMWNGRKYHYKNGDWEKDIQPVTDRLCGKYALPVLEHGGKEKRGVSYLEWLQKKNLGFSANDVIRADIDYAVRLSSGYEEFKSVLRKFGYRVTREGYSEKRGEPILSIVPPLEGRTRARRTYTLGKGYSVPDIMRKLEGRSPYGDASALVMGVILKRTQPVLAAPARKGRNVQRLIWDCGYFYGVEDPFGFDQRRIRKDILRLDRLVEEFNYLQALPDPSYAGLLKRRDELAARKKSLLARKQTLLKVAESLSGPEKELVRQYSPVSGGASPAPSAEGMGEVESPERLLPENILSSAADLEETEEKLASATRELRLLGQILADENPPAPGRPAGKAAGTGEPYGLPSQNKNSQAM